MKRQKIVLVTRSFPPDGTYRPLEPLPRNCAVVAGPDWNMDGHGDRGRITIEFDDAVPENIEFGEDRPMACGCNWGGCSC